MPNTSRRLKAYSLTLFDLKLLKIILGNHPAQKMYRPPLILPELNDIERIWKYVKGASLANYDFGHVANLRQAITEVFDEINSNVKNDLTLRFRDPISKNLLKVA